MSDLPARLRDEARRDRTIQGDGLTLWEEAATKIDELSDEVWLLYDVFLAARALTEECKGGALPPSLGALARLESALSVTYHSRAYRGWADIKEWAR